MSLLSTKDLSRHFGGLKAVESVDFDLPAGQVRALIGPNGAGKTTFVGMLSGRIPASRGKVVFDGRDITSGTRQDQRSIFGSGHHPQHLLLTHGEHPSNLGQDVGSPHGIQRDHFNRRGPIVLRPLDIATVVFNDETSQFLQNRIIPRGKQTICRSDRKQLRTLVSWQLVDERT